MSSSEVKAVRWTSKDLEGFPDNGIRYEIIDGELFRTQMPHLHHQMVMGHVYFCLNIWSEKTDLGEAVFCPGIIFSESNDVIPDVVWNSHKRLAKLLDDDGDLRGAPELVVEV